MINCLSSIVLSLLVFSLSLPGATIQASERRRLICGTGLLRKNHHLSSVTIRAALRSQRSQTARIKSSINPSFNVGDKKTFNVYNFVTNGFDSVEAVYRTGGNSCYIFVPDADYVTAKFGGKDPLTILNQVVAKFENTILPLERAWIGNEPNPGIDGDPKIYFLITDIKDGSGFGGGYVAGFFNSGDQLTTDPGTNKLDILYMDLSPGNVGDDDWFGTMAHEFSHLVHFSQGGGSENRWIDEGTATLIDFIFTGKTLQPQVSRFLDNPNISLVEESADFWFGQNPFPYYGQSLLFLLYLRSQYGGATEAGQQTFIRKLVAENQNGAVGVQAVTGVPFSTIFDDWSTANVVNSATANSGKWSYPEETDSSSVNDLSLPVKTESKNINVTGSLNVSSSVVNWGNRYYEYSGSGDLDLTFQGSDSSAPYVVTLITWLSTGSIESRNITLDSSKRGTIQATGLGSALVKAVVRVSANKTMSGDTGNVDYAFTMVSNGVATTAEGVLVPLVNPGLPSSINMVARLDKGFSNTPAVTVTINGSAQTLTMNRVSSTVYQGALIFPANFTGNYTAVLSGTTSEGKAFTNTFTFNHSFK